MNYYEEEENYLGDLEASKVPAPKTYTMMRGDRFTDLNNTTLVVVFSSVDTIKLMPIKENAIIQVYEKWEFIRLVSECKILPSFTPKPNRKNISEYLMEYQFNMIGKTMKDVDSNENWKNEWKLSVKQKTAFKSFAMSALKKVFKFNTAKARETYEFFDKEFGLKTFS